MKYTQNDRISQLTETTLIVGVDIASQIHYARAFDFRGIEHGKVVKFTNDLEGFMKLQLWIEDLCARHKKDHIVIGMEPTGHYWFSLAEHAKSHGIKAVLVNPYHVKRFKELDDNNPTKNDRKDPKTIAMLVKDGRYVTPYIPDGVYSDLRTAMSIQSDCKQLSSVKNRVKRWFISHQFNTVFASWEGKAAQICLNSHTFISARASVSSITHHWKEAGRGRRYKRATKLYKAIALRGHKSGSYGRARKVLEEYTLLKHRNSE